MNLIGEECLPSETMLVSQGRRLIAVGSASNFGVWNSSNHRKACRLRAKCSRGIMCNWDLAGVTLVNKSFMQKEKARVGNELMCINLITTQETVFFLSLQTFGWTEPQIPDHQGQPDNLDLRLLSLFNNKCLLFSALFRDIKFLILAVKKKEVVLEKCYISLLTDPAKAKLMFLVTALNAKIMSSWL